MVKIIDPVPSFLNELLGRVGQGLQGYGQNQYLQQQQQQKLQEQQQQRNQLAQWYQSIGLPPELVDQPDWVQKTAVKEATSPESLFEKIGSMAGGGKQVKLQQQYGGLSPQSQQPGQINNQNIPLKVGDQIVNVNPQNLTPQMSEQLQEAGVDIPLPGLPGGPLSEPGKALSSGGFGLLTQLLGKGGDIGALLTSGAAKGLEKTLGLGESLGLGNVFQDVSPQGEEREQAAERWRQEMEKYEPGTKQYEDAKMYAEGFAKPEKGFQEALSEVGEGAYKYSPTTENIQKVIQNKVKGTVFEDYITPKSKEQKIAQDVGSLIALVSNPVEAAKKGGVELVKELAKATGVSAGSKAAGWLTEEATGSKLLGDIVTHGGLMAYNIFGGNTMGQAASKKYDEFNQKVIKPATEKGVKIRPSALNKLIKKANKELKLYPVGSKAHDTLSPYVARLENMARESDTLTPKLLWNNAKGMNENLGSVPKVAKESFTSLVKDQKKVLSDFGNKVFNGAGDLLKEADNIYASKAAATKIFNALPKILNPKNISIGSGIWFLGGLKPLVGFGMGYAGYKYMAEMLKNPTMRTLLGQAYKATANNNAVLLNKLSRRIDKKAQEIDPALYEAMNKAMQQNQS